MPVAVYTQPDRPAGRGRRPKASPVKEYAAQQGISVEQPESLRDEAAQARLAGFRPDVVIVAAYGLILPQAVLDIPSHGCLNVHASILPRWRGAAPIQAAILAGDRSTGVSLMKMEAGLDSGPVYSTCELQIGSDETAAELHDRLARLGGELLVADMDAILAGKISAEPQEESLVTYAGKIEKQHAHIDWSLSAAELQRHIRAYNPAPGAFFFADDTDGNSQRVKVWGAERVPGIESAPGSIVRFDRDEIVVACGSDGLRLTELQLAGKRRAPAHEFVAQIDLRR